jgi:hypothetical protein
MKMGTIASPWRYDAEAGQEIPTVILRCPAILHEGDRALARKGRIWLCDNQSQPVALSGRHSRRLIKLG